MDGSLDTTFGGGFYGAGSGKFNVTFGSGLFGEQEFATGVAIDDNDRIVIVGYSDNDVNGGPNDFAVARILANGSGFDTSFSGDGKLTFDFGLGLEDRAQAVAIQPDGKIVVAGSTQFSGTDHDFAAIRINPIDGTLDSSFNGTGELIHNFALGGGSEDKAVAVAVDSLGRIVLAGYAQGTDATRDAALLRLNSNGTVSGQQSISFGSEDTAAAVAIGSDDAIVLAGTVDSASADWFVARYTAALALDTSFSGDGKLLEALGDVDFATGIALQPDDKIVVVGYTNDSGTNNFEVIRYLPNGNRDTAFGSGGRATIDFGGEDQAFAVALDPADRVVVVGRTGSDMAIARLTASEIHGPMIVVGGDTTQGGIFQFEPVGPGGVFEDVGFFKPFGVLPGIAMRTYAVDVNNDDVPDTVAVTGPGTPIRVMVMSGVDNTTVLVAPFDPFGGNFQGGGFVGGADFDADGRDEFFVTPDEGGGPRVTVFELQPNGDVQTKANFFGITDETFRGGARAAAGDIDGDGIPDIAVGAGFLGGPRVAVFDGATLFTTGEKMVNDFFGFPGDDAVTLRNGVFLTIGDINGDGFSDLIVGGGPGGAPRVYILDGELIATNQILSAYDNPIANFFVAGNDVDRGGIRVSTVDADGDNRADLVTGSGTGSPARVRIYRGDDFIAPGEPGIVEELVVLGGGPLTFGVFVG